METNVDSRTTAISTRSVGIRFGLISAVISVAYFVILNLVGIDMTQGVWNWFGYVLIIALLVLAHKYYKDNGDGYMSYGQGIGIALWLGIISALISSIFTYLYIKFIDTTFVETIKDRQMEAMQEKGMSDEQIDQAMQFSAMFMSPEAMFFFILFGGVVATIIIALIVTIFTQKKNPEPTF
jgi:hypothetical protein